MQKRLLANLLVLALLAAPRVVFGQDLPTQVKLLSGVYGDRDNSLFNNPRGIFFDRTRGEIYVADAGNHRVVVFDGKGNPIDRFTHMVVRDGKRGLGEPRSIAVNSKGDIILTDALAPYLEVLDFRGNSVRIVTPLDLLGPGPGQLIFEQLAMGAADTLYVSTSGSQSQILVLDPSLRLIRRLGKTGKGEGSFHAISGIAVDQSGRVYVTDVQNEPAVQVLSPEGNFLLGFGEHDAGWMNFSYPAGVAITKDNNMGCRRHTAGCHALRFHRKVLGLHGWDGYSAWRDALPVGHFFRRHVPAFCSRESGEAVSGVSGCRRRRSGIRIQACEGTGRPKRGYRKAEPHSRRS